MGSGKRLEAAQLVAEKTSKQIDLLSATP